MPKGILVVESWPNSPEEAAEYHKWYDETHIPEIVAIDGFTSARRYAPAGGDGPFVTIYEIDSDDELDSVQARMYEQVRSGATSTPVGVRMDPPPQVRFLREITSYAP